MKLWPFGSDDAPERVDPVVTPQDATITSREKWEDLFEDLGHTNSTRLTRDSAMRSSAVFACVQLLSGLISILPFPVYRWDGSAWRLHRDHSANELLNGEPNAILTAGMFKNMLMEDRLLEGDHYSRIERTRNGDVMAFHPFQTHAVGTEKFRGRLLYIATDDEGREWTLDQDDMLHIPSVGFNGIRSLTPIQYAARGPVSISLAGDEFSEQFFKNGAFSNLVLESEKKIGPDLAEVIRSEVQKRMSGLENAHKPLVLQEGLTAKDLKINAEDAQLLETRNFQIHDIARVYGVPPHMIGATDKQTSWGTGLEQQTLAFLTFTLQRHLKFIEDEINRKVVRGKKYKARFDVEEILRADSKARSDFFRQAIGGSMGPGWMTTNEIRAKQDLL